MAIIAKTKPEFEKAFDFLSKEFMKLRTGQASPALVEDILVDTYGQKMPLKQLGSISTPERRQILIQPWDVSSLEFIERALQQQSTLGASPIVEKTAIRITLPPLNQEFRDQILKIVMEKAEEARLRRHPGTQLLHYRLDRTRC